MDEKEAGRGSYGGDPTDQFHRNEAISAVAEEGFIVEDDDDYEDLYNDVNVGENVLQSLRKNDDNLGERSEEVQDNRVKLAQPQVLPGEGVPSGAPGRVETYQNVGVMGNSNVNDVSVGVGRGALPPSGGGFKVELGQASNRVNNTPPNNPQMVHHHQPLAANMGSTDNVGNMGNVNGTSGNVYGGGDVGRGPVGVADGSVGVGGTILFVGDLHWWTTDSELESELYKYGPVKEVKFFDERASGKSKGYCQVEFFDPGSATTCKEGMNGHIFNGRPCVVAYASPYSVKRMGEAQVNRNQPQIGTPPLNQPRKGPGDFPSKPGGVGANIAPGGNPTAGDNNGRGFGRGNWGRGNAQGGMGNRAPMGPMRNRGMGVRGLANGNGFGQGIGAGPPMMHPQAMGFDPAFGGPMGRMGGYGGFPGATGAPFSGLFPSFPVGNVGLPGVAPHVNPAFFGRGMPGMGMVPNPGVDGPNMGMWSDPNMGGWAGDEHGGRAGESSYGEEAASDHPHAEGSQEKGPWSNASREKDRDYERDLSASPDRRYRDDRGSAYDRDISREKDVGRDHDWSERRPCDDKDAGRDRERVRDRDHERPLEHERARERARSRDRDRYTEHHRHRNHDAEYNDDYDKGKSSRTRSKSRVSHDDEHRSRSRR